MTTTRPATDSVQRHVVGTLVVSQMLGGVGMSAGVAVGALLAEQVSGSARWAGLGGTFQILGAAVIAIPMSRLMAARGRRPGLALGYVLAAIGADGLVSSEAPGAPAAPAAVAVRALLRVVAPVAAFFETVLLTVAFLSLMG